MSQTETFLLPDGRKTSDLKVNELKKELEKLGKSKSGNKSELLNRLNESFTRTVIESESSEIEKENSEFSEIQNELNNSNQDEKEDISPNDHRTVKRKISRFSVDLDAADEPTNFNTEINQSVDALDLYVPIDDSLNAADESIQEERIQVTISRNEEVETNDNEGDDTRVVETITADKRTVICVSNDSETNKQVKIDSEKVVDLNTENEPITGEIDKKETEVEKRKLNITSEAEENEPDEMENIELETQIEMYDVDNIDIDGGQMEMMYEEQKDESIVKSQEQRDENIIGNIEKDLRETEFLDMGINEGEKGEETEEGEVITIPITARLGKRKVREEEVSKKSHSSPKKSKKKGLKETKGAGYIIEGPERIAPAQKPRNIASDVLRIDNLVRPFTLIQLQDMLALQGPVTDLWLNKIKSVAYVRYETESIAGAARETIDGCRWPSINPKLLSCDFVSLREMEWMKEKGDSGVNPPLNIRQPATQQQQEQKESLNKQKENKGEQMPSQQQEQPKPTTADENERRHQDKSKQLAVGNVDNEWRHQDKSKQTSTRDQQQPSHRSDRNDDVKRQRGKDHQREQMQPDNTNSSNRRRQRSPLPDHRRHYDSQKEPKPRERNKEEKPKENKNQQALPPPPVAAAKLLEDIFRKTVTQPAIYWLPVAREKEEPIKKVKETVKV